MGTPASIVAPRFVGTMAGWDCSLEERASFTRTLPSGTRFAERFRTSSCTHVAQPMLKGTTVELPLMVATSWAPWRFTPARQFTLLTRFSGTLRGGSSGKMNFGQWEGTLWKFLPDGTSARVSSNRAPVELSDIQRSCGREGASAAWGIHFALAARRLNEPPSQAASLASSVDGPSRRSPRKRARFRASLGRDRPMVSS